MVQNLQRAFVKPLKMSLEYSQAEQYGNWVLYMQQNLLGFKGLYTSFTKRWAMERWERISQEMKDDNSTVRGSRAEQGTDCELLLITKILSIP